jgi:hypothetical protein
VTVTITPSVVPVAVNDPLVTTTTGATVIIPVLANDTITAPATINPLSVAVTPPTGAIAPNTDSGSAAANPTGTVSYRAPATPGTYAFTYTVQNSVVAPATPSTSNVATVTVNVTQGHIAPVANNMPAVIATAGATIIIDVKPNVSATAPSLIDPASLTLTTPTGGTAAARLDGTILYTAPSTPGTYTFTYTVKDNFTPPATSNVATVTVTVGAGTAPVAITTANPLPGYTIGSGAYDNIINATGGTAPYTFSITTGALPAGITLFPNGQLFGGGATVAGSYGIIVTATDSLGATASKAFTLVVSQPVTLAIATASPVTSYAVGSGVYNGIITATGGIPPYTFFNPVGGTGLPSGISLFPNGQLFGGGATVPGTYTFNVTVFDSNSSFATKAFTLVVTPGPLAITTTSPLATYTTGTGVPYDNIVQAGGGNAPYTFAVTAGALPPGIGFFSNGQVYGVGTTPGTYNFTVTVTDSTAATASKAFSLDVL